MNTSESIGGNPFRLDRLRIAPDEIGPTTIPGRPPRHRPKEAFLRGPISFDWLAAACRLPGVGLHVILTVRVLRARYRQGGGRRWGQNTIAADLGVSARSVRRGLAAAESTGLVAIDREPGRRVVVGQITIREPAESGKSGRKPLYGPIPWRWLRPALMLPGPALATAMAIWCVAGWERAATFGLRPTDWADLGLSRSAADRGLRALERAGLVAVERARGCRSIVTILDPAMPGSAPTGAGVASESVGIGWAGK
jgi:DNA-binding transcriptional ArsR family regulator